MAVPSNPVTESPLIVQPDPLTVRPWLAPANPPSSCTNGGPVYPGWVEASMIAPVAVTTGREELGEITCGPAPGILKETVVPAWVLA